MKKFKTICMLATIMLIVSYCFFMLVPTTQIADSVDLSLEKVFKAKKFVLGVDKNFPPMSFIESDDIIGFDIDMMKEFCKRLNVELDIVPIEWDDKEEELISGRIDCIGSMSVVPEAKEIMGLSSPYIRESLIFVVPINSKIEWLHDLKGKNVGVQEGSTTQEIIEKLSVYSDISMVLFKDNIEILHNISVGKLDAGLVDSVSAYYFISLYEGSFYILSENVGEEEFALGFRKNDIALCDKVQQILSEMKYDGTVSKISIKWFGSDITLIQ